MVAWLFRWHDEHRRTALLPGIAFLGFFGLQLFTEIRFHEPVLVEPVGDLIAGALILMTLVSGGLSLAHWVRTAVTTDVIVHMDRHAMGVERVRMVVERAIREMAPWNQPTSSAGNPRVITHGLYGKGRPLAAVDDDPTEVFDEVVRFNQLDIAREPPTDDVAAS
jgi:hypothetical protein